MQTTARTKAQKQQRDEYITELRDILKPGDTVYCVLRHVSRSGMCRHIDLYKMTDDGPQWLTWKAAHILEWPLTGRNDEYLRVDGCGMDMGFHTVYVLSSILYRGGYQCIGYGDGHKTRCPAATHNNERERNYDTARHHDHDGGYALKSAWL